MQMSTTARKGGHGGVLPTPSRPHALALALTAALFCPAGYAVATGSASMADFDVDSLRARGLDPALAAYFREAPRFSAGERRVGLVINGQSRGTLDARFDASGELRFDARFLQDAALRIPPAPHQLAPPEAEIYDFLGAWPQAVLRLDPANNQVELVVPEAALDERPGEIRHYSTGGVAALINYGVNSSVFRTERGTRRNTSANIELGLNAGDWIVRSRSALNAGEAGVRVQQLETYAQRSSVNLQQVLQLGEINVTSPLFGGTPIVGLQVVPEEALRQSDEGGALVEGNAASEARVEIRQAGMLLHSTVVPPGPFAIGDFRVLNHNLDLEVTVEEASGTRSFIVPASSFRRASLSVPGATFAAGQIRRFGGEMLHDNPVVVSATTAWRSRRADAVFSAGFLATPYYQSVAVGLDTPLAAARLSTRALWSTDRTDGSRGGQIEARISAPIGSRLNLNVTASQRTDGYRELLDATYGVSDHWSATRNKRQWSAGLNVSGGVLGSFSGSYSPRQTFDGRSSNRVGLSWSKRLGQSLVSLSLDRDTNSSPTGARRQQSAYLSVTVPLGPTSVRATARTRSDSTYLGVGVDHQDDNGIAYRLSAEREMHSGQESLYAGISAIPRYAQVSLGYSQSGQSQALSGSATGGLLVHRNGLTLSPYPLRDTFGLVKIGDRAGTRISTPGGTVWTDMRGHAVIPQMTAFGVSRIEVETKSLPRHYELDNGVRVLEASRGSVSRVEFGVTTTRRVLARIVDEHGQPIAKGTPVMAGEEFVTSVGDRGIAFINNYQPDQKLTLSLPEAAQCSLSINLQQEQNEDLFYENASATCHVL